MFSLNFHTKLHKDIRKNCPSHTNLQYESFVNKIPLMLSVLLFFFLLCPLYLACIDFLILIALILVQFKSVSVISTVRLNHCILSLKSLEMGWCYKLWSLNDPSRITNSLVQGLCSIAKDQFQNLLRALNGIAF